MNILGVSFDYHDSAAALLVDGHVVAAAHEERFTRRKNDHRLPQEAIRFCCEQANIAFADLDHIVFYEQPGLKFARIFEFSHHLPQARQDYFLPTLDHWLKAGKFTPAQRLATFLGVPAGKVHTVRHHASHAASAFFCSPFEKATVVTLDGVGEYETTTISRAEGLDIEPLARVTLPHSLGLFYSAITAFLGFRVNEDEYKVMGMAGFGKPRFLETFRKLFDLRDDGSYRLDQRYFHFTTPVDVPYTQALVHLLGEPREPESLFSASPHPKLSPQALERCRHYADIAASAQSITEEVILHIVSRAVQTTGLPDVCLAGGVALNSLANGKLRQTLQGSLYVQPSAGDAGGSLGAALHWNHSVLRQPRRGPLTHAYLGKAYSHAEVREALLQSHTRESVWYDNEQALCEATAAILLKGAVVGWLNGRFEFGPRALGARSILANPLYPDMQAIVNERIKFREPFRPFAPAVPEEDAAQYFNLPPIRHQTDPEYFMLSICTVKDAYRDRLPAITHVDGTARVQLVNSRTQPCFHRLLKVFGTHSGIPVLMNTSFNLRGEPIVNTPLNAIRTFEWSDMDYLVLEQCILRKALTR